MTSNPIILVQKEKNAGEKGRREGRREKRKTKNLVIDIMTLRRDSFIAKVLIELNDVPNNYHLLTSFCIELNAPTMIILLYRVKIFFL